MPDSVHWRNILGNPYTKNPDIKMLQDGQISSERRSIRGWSKGDVARIFVIRDRDYVIKWIAKKLIIPLGIHRGDIAYNDFQKLIKEAVTYARQADNDNEGIPSQGESKEKRDE